MTRTQRSAIQCILLLAALVGTTFAQPSAKERCALIAQAPLPAGRFTRQVLDIACSALDAGRFDLVSIEDLWAIALKEGRTLFDSPRLWDATGPEQTGDMLGQTTIGPWQITLQNAREYGAPHGIVAEWMDREVVAWLQQHPELQARIAADYIEESYRKYGLRTPLAIQRYFWLDGFLQKKIGQGPWYASVLAKSPETMNKTGFYAKQLLLGSRYNPQGLLYWLHVTGDRSAIREALDAWAQAGYPILQEDLTQCRCKIPYRDLVELP